MTLREEARAKVNLHLHVTGRRADGYHLLDSLAVFPAAADTLAADPAGSVDLRIEGPHGAGLDAGPGNLVRRAADALAQVAGVSAGAALVLHKALPVASGIGGGSADAAATLRLLRRLWNVTLAPAEIAAMAARLGADVPVCVASVPARMGGVGDVLTAAPALPPYGMVLVNPGVAVATQAVFRARTGAFTPPAVLPAGWIDASAMANTLQGLRNDLEAPALALCPAVRDVLSWLETRPGCLLARMSGSGATCFGLFAPGPAAEALAAGIPTGWWGWGGTTD